MNEKTYVLLNSHGDITYFLDWRRPRRNVKSYRKRWTKDMFFIIKPNFGLSKKQVSLNKNNIDKLNKNKNILIRDKDLDIFLKTI